MIIHILTIIIDNMNINKLNNSKISFGGSLYSNQTLLKGLKYASENAALVAAGTTLLFSTVVRPAMVLLTPDVPKEDKQYACSKFIASGVLGSILTFAIFSPLSKAVDSITDSPRKYLKAKTIKTLKQSAKNLDESGAYNFLKQIVKLSPELLAIIPKAFITAVLIVPVSQLLFKKNKEEKKKVIQNKVQDYSAEISFKGGAVPNNLSKNIATLMENKKVQEMALKYKDSNFIQHILNFKDIVATFCFAAVTSWNSKLKEENKKALIYNTFISTGLTIGGGYIVNKLLDKPMEKFTENFVKANQNDPHLYKYLNGIKVVKPIVILSSLYYIFIPMLSTLWADKLVKKDLKNFPDMNSLIGVK